MLSHPLIAEVAVIATPCDVFGEKVTAVVVLKKSEIENLPDAPQFDLNSLRIWGKERMAIYKVPQKLEIVHELPRNAMGKVEKKKVMELIRTRDEEEKTKSRM